MEISSVINAALAAEVHDALDRIHKAQQEVRFIVSPARDACVRELLAAEMSLSRVLTLVGEE